MARAGRVVLGSITAAHGIRGEVKLRSFTADPDAIASYGPLDTDDGRTVEIEALKPLKGGFVARLRGVEDRNAAESLAGQELSVPRERLPAPGPDEVYHADLVGLEARLAAGGVLGTVTGVLDFGAGELLEVRPPDARSTVLVPFNRETVPEIDLDGGFLTVDPPEGLLGEE